LSWNGREKAGKPDPQVIDKRSQKLSPDFMFSQMRIFS